ncbi:MAG: DUF2867 domain-containing protein [Salinivirgaceae bacterium]|nr:MAG: DUF2867 domain-containing protein [Salinivirgaceae bacterium]
MKVLLTGATGYIGKRLVPVLLQQGCEIYALTRDRKRLNLTSSQLDRVHVIEGDLLNPDDKIIFPEEIDVAFYLVHSMSGSIRSFYEQEERSAKNFIQLINRTKAQQIIYLSGLGNEEKLSEHLSSRQNVEKNLRKAKASLTVLRAGIIIGSGSASFEIMRDLVEKLPVMVAPKWLKSICQPIAVRNIVEYLTGVMLMKESYNRTFDVGGEEVLTYKQMLMKFAKVRRLKRLIISVPVMTPRLSSYWLYFVTATSYKLAVNLVDSLKIDVICENNDIRKLVPIDIIPYEEAISLAFERIEQNMVLSSWKDAVAGQFSNAHLDEYVSVPEYGCFKVVKKRNIEDDLERIKDNIWRIGGEHGWYYGTWLWGFRGFLDKLVGGVGLRRGRTNPDKINTGDALDFWRVIYAAEDRTRLLLYAEMKLPGEAWLEFKISRNKDGVELMQTATYRPRGIWGRFYWYLSWPFHLFIFPGMIRKIIQYKGR